jgi:O-antigen ligase
MKMKNSLIKLTIASLVTGLFLSFTNLIPIYPAFVLFAAVFAMILMAQNHKKTFSAFKDGGVEINIQKYALLLGAYFITSALLSGIPAIYFFKYMFYRYDANYFVTFFPLFVFPVMALSAKITYNLNKYVMTFVIFIAAINLALLAPIFLFNKSLLGYYNPEFRLYSFLFEAHNAAGGYLAFIVLINLSFVLYAGDTINKKRKYVLYISLGINVLSLILTASRGSILAALLAVLFFHIKGRKLLTTAMLSSIATLLLIAYLLGYAMYTPDEDSEIIEKKIKHTISMLDDKKQIERLYSVLDRTTHVWPMAIDDFIKSPLIGIGFTRYNDLPYKFKGIKYFVYLNRSEKIYSNPGHAHHSFLHILGETGVIGLMLTIILLFNIIRFINIYRTKNIILGNALYLGIIACIISSFTEHRLFTPAQMLPFTIILSLVMLEGNNVRHKSSE